MYFDKARKGRTGGKMINPNDPQENPDLFSDYEAQAPAPPSKIKAEPERPLEQEAVRTTYESRRNKEDGVLRQFRDPPARQEDMSSRAATESTHQRGGRVASSGETYKKSARNSMGSDNSFEHSPLHNHARTPARGGVDSSSPSWEGKSVYRNSQGTPGRSRMRPNPRGDESVSFFLVLFISFILELRMCFSKLHSKANLPTSRTSPLIPLSHEVISYKIHLIDSLI